MSSATDTPKGTAWLACQVAYSKRIVGMAPARAPATDFDVEYVVSGTPKPTGAELAEHARTWGILRQRFDAEWNARSTA